MWSPHDATKSTKFFVYFSSHMVSERTPNGRPYASPHRSNGYEDSAISSPLNTEQTARCFSHQGQSTAFQSPKPDEVDQRSIREIQAWSSYIAHRTLWRASPFLKWAHFSQVFEGHEGHASLRTIVQNVDGASATRGATTTIKSFILWHKPVVIGHFLSSHDLPFSKYDNAILPSHWHKPWVAIRFTGMVDQMC